jgi:hypothetical protein
MPDGFEAGIRLIYDDSRAMTSGDAPDFEAYRARLNSELETGSITVGQEDFWERREADKENARQRADYRNKYPSHYVHYKPSGDPGPGGLAIVDRYSKKGCTYRWNRWSERAQGITASSVTVPPSALLNVSAYEPGDFRQFYADPRTRADYVQWAPLLLAAEEYWAGNLFPGNGTEDRFSLIRAVVSYERYIRDFALTLECGHSIWVHRRPRQYNAPTSYLCSQCRSLKSGSRTRYGKTIESWNEETDTLSRITYKTDEETQAAWKAKR